MNVKSCLGRDDQCFGRDDFHLVNSTKGPKGVLPLFVRSLNLLNLAIGQRGKFSKPRLLSFACLSDALRVTRADSGRSIFAARILVLE